MSLAGFHDNVIVIVLHVVMDYLLETGEKTQLSKSLMREGVRGGEGESPPLHLPSRNLQVCLLIKVQNTFPKVMHFGQDQSMFNIISCLHQKELIILTLQQGYKMLYLRSLEKLKSSHFLRSPLLPATSSYLPKVQLQECVVHHIR